MVKPECAYPNYARLIHLGLAIFGTAAFLTAELAESGYDSFGYLLHTYLGLSLATFMLLRIIIGLSSSETLSFRAWSVFSLSQWRIALKDLKSLLKLKLPDNERHQGLAGLIQAFGLLIFSWMALTGIVLFFVNTGLENELFEVIEELHEIGETLIPIYLGLHIGAVILHSLSGSPVWRRMFASK